MGQFDIDSRFPVGQPNEIGGDPVCCQTGGEFFSLIKTKKYEDLSASAMQNVNFITATVTLLTFQTVFMDTFASKTAIQIFGGISGFVVCAVVVMFGIYMLVKGKKAQRNMENRLKGLEKN
jgi:hypothetical protein